MSDPKTKFELDKELDEALKETFPGSDSIAVDATEGKPVRPADRKPPKIDKELVSDLAKRAKKQST